MRFAPTVLAVVMPVLMASAQEQERKLVDRLLKPDTALQNSEQGKKFTAGGSVEARSTSPKSFYLSEEKFGQGLRQ